MKKKILISGAGIAGPTLAYWLHRAGWAVTVIEKADKPRLGGQNIDISDAAIDIVKLMGLEQEILRHNTTEIGLKIVNSKNETEAIFPKSEPLAFTSKYEILRGDLAEILIALTKSDVTYRFGQEIESLENAADAVTVTFKNGEKVDYDLVVGADGVSSATRKNVIGNVDPYKYLGVYTSYATLPKAPSDEKWARWYNAPQGKVLLLRPDNKGTTRASVNFWFNGPSDAHFSHDEAITALRRELSGAGWESDRIARQIDQDPDLYLGPVSQVRAPSWSKGRCVLVGDAAYCPTPFTGMGTSLAIIGAYVLAGELATEKSYAKALQNYEKKLRPFVEEIQKVFPGQFRWVYPQSRAGVKIFNFVLSVASSKTVQNLMRLLRKKPKEAQRRYKLPIYEGPGF